MMKREKQRYEKPMIKFVEIDLSSSIANIVTASTYTGKNSNEAWGTNGYQDKDITVGGKDLSETWGSGWNNRNRNN